MPSSISNSSHRAPDLNYRNAILAALAVALSAAAALAAANAYFDPFNFGAPGPKAPFDRVNQFRLKNTALWEIASVERVLKALPEASDAQYLIIGDSRARAMTGSWRKDSTLFVQDHRGRKIFNLAYGGADLTTSLMIYERYKARFPKAETVIFAVQFDELSDTERRTDQMEEALRIAKNPLFYYVSFRTLKVALDGMKDREKFAPRQDASAKLRMTKLTAPKKYRRTMRYPATNDLQKLFDDARTIRLTKLARTTILNSDPSVVARNIDSIIRPVVERDPGRKFLFVAMPMHPVLERRVAGEKAAGYAAMASGLRGLGFFYDASMYDGAATAFKFIDAMHVKDAAPDIMQDAIDCSLHPTDHTSVIAHDGHSPCPGGD